MNYEALLYFNLVKFNFICFNLIEVKAEPAEVEKKPEVEPESLEPTGRGSMGVFMSLNPEWFWQCCGSGSGGSRSGGSGIIDLLNPDLYKVTIIKDPPKKFKKKDIFNFIFIDLLSI
jgi:hypothetical protein